jgi:hypothetical protein
MKKIIIIKKIKKKKTHIGDNERDEGLEWAVEGALGWGIHERWGDCDFDHPDPQVENKDDLRRHPTANTRRK